jgi:hypothetical protein
MVLGDIATPREAFILFFKIDYFRFFYHLGKNRLLFSRLFLEKIDFFSHPDCRGEALFILCFAPTLDIIYFSLSLLANDKRKVARRWRFQQWRVVEFVGVDGSGYWLVLDGWKERSSLCGGGGGLRDCILARWEEIKIGAALKRSSSAKWRSNIARQRRCAADKTAAAQRHKLVCTRRWERRTKEIVPFYDSLSSIEMNCAPRIVIVWRDIFAISAILVLSHRSSALMGYFFIYIAGFNEQKYNPVSFCSYFSIF